MAVFREDLTADLFPEDWQDLRSNRAFQAIEKHLMREIDILQTKEWEGDIGTNASRYVAISTYRRLIDKIDSLEKLTRQRAGVKGE